MTFIVASCKKTEEKNPLKLGVFGGSISVYPESDTAKKIWEDNLDIVIESLGVGGAGFSSLTSNNVPLQIEKAQVFDIYILWASTNDAVNNVEVGEENYDDLTTQNGGILECIKLIKQKNRTALILLFVSLPRFDREEYYNRLQYFVDGQIAVCTKNKIPYLNQWQLCGFDENNFTRYYLPDKIHLNEEGYRHIGSMQMEFIRENIEKHIKKN